MEELFTNCVHLTIIKSFKLSEFIYSPRHIKYKFRSLRDYKKVRKLVKRRGINFRGGHLSSVRNPFAPDDKFWVDFLPDSNILLKPLPLSLFPFRLQLDNLSVGPDEKFLERSLKTKIIDSKIQTQIRIYPIGFFTIHLYWFINTEVLEPKHLLRMLSNPRRLKIIVGDSRPTLETFWFNVANQCTKIIFGKNTITSPEREIRGYFVAYNFQGATSTESQSSDISSFLLNSSANNSQINNYKIEGKYPSDSIFLSERSTLFNIDGGLLSQVSQPMRNHNLLEPRRCFRHHLVSTIEIAYIISAFFDEVQKELSILNTSLRTPMSKISSAEIKILSQMIHTYGHLLSFCLKDKYPWTSDVFTRMRDSLKISQKIKAIEGIGKSVSEYLSEISDRNVSVFLKIREVAVEFGAKVLAEISQKKK